jgi:hypothetical protein
LERKPGWNRLGLLRDSDDTSGRLRVGLEICGESMWLRYEGTGGRAGKVISGEGSSGDTGFCGVFSKSANVPCSLSSSRQRTLCFFLTGVNATPLRVVASLRRRGDDLIGEAIACCWAAEKTGAGIALWLTLMDFFRFGVPRLVGGNNSTGIMEPSGLTTWDAAE